MPQPSWQPLGTGPPVLLAAGGTDRGRPCKFAIAPLRRMTARAKWSSAVTGQERVPSRTVRGQRHVTVPARRSPAVRTAEEAACPGECAGAGAGLAGQF